MPENPPTRRKETSPPSQPLYSQAPTPRHPHYSPKEDYTNKLRPGGSLHRGYRHGRIPRPPGAGSSPRHTFRRRLHTIHDQRQHLSRPYRWSPHGTLLHPSIHGVSRYGPHQRQHQPTDTGTDTHPPRGHPRRKTGGCCGSGNSRSWSIGSNNSC